MTQKKRLVNSNTAIELIQSEQQKEMNEKKWSYLTGLMDKHQIIIHTIGLSEIE